MRTTLRSPLHVALGVPPVSGHTQRILQGVARYSSERTAWTFEFNPWNHYRSVPSLKDADGVIALTADDNVASEIAASGLPTVNIGATAHGGPRFPTVYTDHSQISRLAAQDFYERGFERIAFVGPHFPYDPSGCM